MLCEESDASRFQILERQKGLLCYYALRWLKNAVLSKYAKKKQRNNCSFINWKLTPVPIDCKKFRGWTLARRLGICQSAVSKSSFRGEEIAEENVFRLV